MNRSLAAKVSEFVKLTKAIHSFENLHRQGFPRLARAALNPSVYGHELLVTPRSGPSSALPPLPNPSETSTKSAESPASTASTASQAPESPASTASTTPPDGSVHPPVIDPSILEARRAIPTGQTGRVTNVRRGDRLVLQKRAMAIPAEAVALKLKNRFRNRL